MNAHNTEQTKLEQLGQSTLCALSMVLYHRIQRGVDDTEQTAERTLRHIIYDPVSRWSPEFYEKHLEMALKSDAHLSEVFPDFASSEESVRKYIRCLVERIRAGTDAPKIEIDDSAKLDVEDQHLILKLLGPLQDPSTREQREKELVKEVADLGYATEEVFEYMTAIQAAVRSPVRLTRFVPQCWTEQGIRDYLVNVWHKIDEAKHNAHVEELRRAGQTAKTDHG